MRGCLLIRPIVGDGLSDLWCFADLNLYPNDIDTLLGLKEKVLSLVDAMAQ